MTTTPTYNVSGFREYFDEFTEALYADTKVQRFLNEANVLAGRVGTEARLYCAAHLLTIDGERTTDAQGRPSPDGGSGVVRSESIGPRSVSYNTTEGRQFYERTFYGRMFLELASVSPRRSMPVII